MYIYIYICIYIYIYKWRHLLVDENLTTGNMSHIEMFVVKPKIKSTHYATP